MSDPERGENPAVVPVRGSFRDRSGFLFEHDGILYRQINECYRADYEAFVGSGLYEELAQRGSLVSHEEVASGVPHDGWKLLRPERLPFISYPYEWCFGQLQDAALHTLDVLEAAILRGLWLKDASAYNIQFIDGKPILIDTLSFERYPEGSPWVAYRQFCQHFLAPLALMALCDIRLGQLLRVHIDGVPLDLASRLLPKASHLRFGLQLHLHTHARMQQRYARQGAQALTDASGEHGRQARTKKMSQRALLSFVESLRGAVKGLSWHPHGTVWSEYYEGDSYEREGLEHKKELILGYLARSAPRTLWDLGANTGMHSRLASSQGIQTLAWDFDPGAVELNYREVKKSGEKNLLPLLSDLTNPSSGIGWANEERMSLRERGPADAIMALALVHHLVIGNNVPLERVAQSFATLGRHLIIELVPKSDAKVKLLLSSRSDIFDDYTREGFEAAFRRHYEIREAQPIRNSERILYWMEART